LVTSRLNRLGCRSKPLRARDLATLAQFDVFFAGIELVLAEVGPAVVERATDLRARHNLKTPDALHDATAVEVGATVFLTGDRALSRCSEVPVEVLTPVSLPRVAHGSHPRPEGPRGESPGRRMGPIPGPKGREIVARANGPGHQPAPDGPRPEGPRPPFDERAPPSLRACASRSQTALLVRQSSMVGSIRRVDQRGRFGSPRQSTSPARRNPSGSA